MMFLKEGKVYFDPEYVIEDGEEEQPAIQQLNAANVTNIFCSGSLFVILGHGFYATIERPGLKREVTLNFIPCPGLHPIQVAHHHIRIREELQIRWLIVNNDGRLFTVNETMDRPVVASRMELVQGIPLVSYIECYLNPLIADVNGGTWTMDDDGHVIEVKTRGLLLDRKKMLVERLEQVLEAKVEDVVDIYQVVDEFGETSMHEAASRYVLVKEGGSIELIKVTVAEDGRCYSQNDYMRFSF